jgi:hypothetical protein
LWNGRCKCFKTSIVNTAQIHRTGSCIWVTIGANIFMNMTFLHFIFTDLDFYLLGVSFVGGKNGKNIDAFGISGLMYSFIWISFFFRQIIGTLISLFFINHVAIDI